MSVSLVSALLSPLLAGAVLVVSPDSQHHTVREAIAAAQPGDTVVVRGGTHEGPVVIDRSIRLVGENEPVIDGGGRGTVVSITAPEVEVRGFVIRRSGRDHRTVDAGIEARAAGALIADNRLEDVLYGISLDQAPGSIVRGNQVSGKDLEPANRGDGIRLWYSSDVSIEGNRTRATRDAVIWYSSGLRVVDNLFEDGRYGLHLMYDDGAEIIGNTLRHNSVGIYLMYSREVTLRDNLMASNRGPSGYGLGLKDVDDVWVDGNWFVDNRVGTWIDTSPRSLDAEGRFSGNVYAQNDIGLALQPSVERNTFWNNAFRDNLEQVSIQGGGQLRGNHWVHGNRGNYWSDYGGFDADGDGVGDVPYRAERLLDDIMDRRPELRLFQFGLAAQAIEFAGRAFPTLRPVPKLVDEAPLLEPPVAQWPGATRAAPWPMVGLSLSLLGLSASGLGLRRLRLPARPERRAASQGLPALRLQGVSKRFGTATVLAGLDLTVEHGEVVALWGPNGAGKTTALKCVLGLLSCEGELLVNGIDARRQGRQARRAIGYVPQEVALHPDLSVLKTMDLYSRLKGAPRQRAAHLLSMLGLWGHRRKRVGALSGGLRQRLALALALLAEPPLLLLDEPTSNLDAAGREQVLRLLGELRRAGTAILFASHRLEEVEALADRVVVLERGRVALTCAPADLASNLGLRTGLRLKVAREHREEAVAILAAANLTPSAINGAIHVAVSPTQKALPIRVLERHGIAVADFALEDGGEEQRPGEAT